MLGQYMMVDKSTLDSLIGLENDDLIESLEKLCEENEVYDIDKLWDGLHFILTGKSACQPIEGHRLSEAIVGVTLFNDEDADFITYIETEDLNHIVKALEKVDVIELRSNFDTSKLRESEIYPAIWDDNEKDSLCDELIQEYTNLLNFYKKALAKKANIVVSIY
ncbi:YfbM family protein [Clostridium sp. N3C]|uniref:YfbM family protein n=1 Tax=Clostridium sp. N3C TaxID=1776758 RepID=UPI0009FA2CF9|nr:YfbM family protein [Clostridium sp. N3C]